MYTLLLAAWVILGLVRVGLKPKPYTLPGKLPIVAFWNLFDETRFTPEALAYHKRMLIFIVQTLGFLLLLALLQGIFGPRSTTDPDELKPGEIRLSS